MLRRSLAALILLTASTGCMGPRGATQYASVRGDCPSDKVKVLEDEGHDVVLDVCGNHEEWHWHAFNGWEYGGPSATQPSPPAPADTDGDGVPDTTDACPNKVGPANPDATKNGCPTPVDVPPPADGDGDGVPDASDACVAVAGIATSDPKTNGCPAPKDGDGDGVVDEKDACPAIAGLATNDPATNGCPGDRDGDGFRDDQDGCPDKPGKANEEKPELNGCPEHAVVITEKQIVIADHIEFATGLAIIRRGSFDLLDRIAALLKDHPELKTLEIQGHTDSRGGDAANMRLSDARAKAVVAALIQRGVAKERLTSKGYGETKPKADNKTKEGQAQNRRVQFEITLREKTTHPAGPGPKGPLVPPTTPIAPGRVPAAPPTK